MAVAALKLTPLIVIVEPGHPLAGEILDMENTGTTKVILTCPFAPAPPETLDCHEPAPPPPVDRRPRTDRGERGQDAARW